MRLLAYLVSGLAHPILIPLYAYALVRLTMPSLFEYLPYEKDQFTLLRIVLNGVIFPVLSLLIIRGLGFIKDFSFDTAESRNGAFIIFVFFYIWLYFSFRLENVYADILIMALLGGMISAILSFIINLVFMKLSIHAVGAGFITALALILAPFAEIPIFWLLITIVLLAGLVGTARLFLKAHTPPEVYIGYVIGLFSVMLANRITF